jgi:hypothetical protein
MEQSSSWTADSSSASQEILNILLSRKVHYRIHTIPKRALILYHSSPVQPT